MTTTGSINDDQTEGESRGVVTLSPATIGEGFDVRVPLFPSPSPGRSIPQSPGGVATPGGEKRAMRAMGERRTTHTGVPKITDFFETEGTSRCYVQGEFSADGRFGPMFGTMALAAR